ncbi:MAG: hypothetical protein M1814_003584 [Vezdaea aestivalis]|nr:MAG: hypothetical protein M1814_003584 [Vezdaea aestivalis]
MANNQKQSLGHKNRIINTADANNNGSNPAFQNDRSQTAATQNKIHTDNGRHGSLSDRCPESPLNQSLQQQNSEHLVYHPTSRPQRPTDPSKEPKLMADQMSPMERWKREARHERPWDPLIGTYGLPDPGAKPTMSHRWTTMAINGYGSGTEDTQIDAK